MVLFAVVGVEAAPRFERGTYAFPYDLHRGTGGRDEKT